jgi:hypothetical protein
MDEWEKPWIPHGPLCNIKESTKKPILKVLFCFKNGTFEAGHLWLMPITRATRKREIRRIMVWGQPGHIFRKTLSWKYPTQKRAGRVAQVIKHLPNKCKALSSNSSTTKKNGTFERRGVQMQHHPKAVGLMLHIWITCGSLKTQGNSGPICWSIKSEHLRLESQGTLCSKRESTLLRMSSSLRECFLIWMCMWINADWVSWIWAFITSC